VKQAHEDLQRRLAALRTRFSDLGARAAAASRALSATMPPPERLLQDLTAVGAEFAVLRAAVLEEAAILPHPPASSSLTRLRDLESVAAALIAADEERAQRAAWDVARENASAVLDRVLTLIHREDREFTALVECQSTAREILASVAGDPPADVATQTSMLEARLRPFVALLTLVEGWNRLDDERCASLQDVIAQSFGRPLGLAALRGKLGYAGEAAAPAPPPRERVEPPVGLFTAATAVEPVAASPVVAGGAEVVAGGAQAVASGTAPAAHVEPPPVIVPPVTPPPPVVPPRTSALPPSLDEPWAAGGSSDAGEVEIRLGEVHIESAQERREREALLERLAAKNAQWWIRARTAFKALASRDVSPANAAREMLAKFPYLLSVPLQQTADFAGGRLAEGYAILLQRLEKEEPGFVETALTRLNPQFTTGGRTETYPLGQELYLYVVAQGRLYKTYPEFLKDVLGHVLPEPGVWTQGGITEEDAVTRIITNGATPGSSLEGTRTLTTPAERAAEQTFAVRTGPLTTRVFTVEAEALKQPVDVEIKLKENDAVSDKAWIIQVPMGRKPEPGKRHRAGGTTVEGLGRDHSAVLIALFNSDPNADKRFELSITLRRKPTPAGTPDPNKPARPSPFAPRR
jgi:hypothetical protein